LEKLKYDTGGSMMNSLWFLVGIFFRFFRKLERVSNRRLAVANGLALGKNTILVGKQQFGTEPFLVSIGEECLITDGVRFITHDGSIQVPLIQRGEKIMDVYSKKSTFSSIEVKNNVFLGVGAIILPGTIVGNNSIVAAGSIVKGVFPDDVVIAGNPAKVLCSIDEYFKKNEARILTFHATESKVVQIVNKVKDL
jgi:acetyltransferase-like isoleucine patch superfamily enzyme